MCPVSAKKYQFCRINYVNKIAYKSDILSSNEKNCLY